MELNEPFHTKNNQNECETSEKTFTKTPKDMLASACMIAVFVVVVFLEQS